jgi:aminoglycoside 3-N-acetyltransferase I
VSYTIQQATPDDLPFMRACLEAFGRGFDDLETYTSNQPDDAYLARLLSGGSFVALGAVEDGQVIGAIAAYELQKFEQARSELYIYDLAVDENHRRRGIATELIEALRTIALQRGAHAMFVQADTGEEDAAAIALYRTLGAEQKVLHFDIAVDPR